MRSRSHARTCGPDFFLSDGVRTVADGHAAIDRTAEFLRDGKIVAIKGLGGYHLACDARNSEANTALRERKFRKEKPFAVMAKDLETARSLIELSSEAEALLQSIARPIVLRAQEAGAPWRCSRQQ